MSNENMVGQYVYFIRRQRMQDGTLLGGIVTRITDDGRLVVSTSSGPRIWGSSQVTTDSRLA